MIQDEIFSGGWQPGHFIGRRQELSAKFGIAPATLGEVIQLLRSRGIVDAKPGPNGGIFVAKRSPFTQLSAELLQLEADEQMLDDGLRVLDSLDGAVLADAITHATDEDIAAINWLAFQLEETWGSEKTENLIWDFHRRIAQISPNRLLRGLYLNLIDYILAEVGSNTVAPLSTDRLRNHLEFAEAIASRDQARGARAVQGHRKQIVESSEPSGNVAIAPAGVAQP